MGQKASTRYVVHREEAIRRLTALTEHLSTPAAREFETKNWADVGTLSQVNEDLHNVMVFLGLEEE